MAYLDALSASCFAIFLLLIIFVSSLSIQRRSVHKKIPCPSSYPIIGNLIALLQNMHRFYDWVTDEFYECSTLTMKVNSCLGLSPVVINTINPINLEYFLKTNFQNFMKGSLFRDNMFELLGHGIFNVDDHLWSVQRKIASYEFNTRSLKLFISKTVQAEITNRLIPYLSHACDEEKVVDLQETFQKFTFDTICNLAFGVDPGCLELSSHLLSNMSFASSFDEATEICLHRMMSPVPWLWKLQRFLNVGLERRLKEAIKVIDDYAMKVIRSKEDTAGSVDDKQDLLSRFMSSNIQLDFNTPEEKVKFYRDIVTNIILAGRDTTSSALTWFFWVISTHPECVRSIFVEVSSVMSKLAVSDVRSLSFDDFKEFHYLHSALSESMRLFPPVPMNSKLAMKDDVLPDGSYVRAGWTAHYNSYSMARMKEIWGSDCREFKPERWLDGDGLFQPCSQFKYPVFHCGPRLCLGKDMAFVQMKAVAAAVIYNFEVVAVDGGGTPKKMLNPPYVVSLTMKMKDGLPVKLKKRQQS